MITHYPINKQSEANKIILMLTVQRLILLFNA